MNDLAEVTNCGQATGGRRRAGDVRQCQDHDQTFLGCHQHISITKPIQDHAFECAGGGRDRWESLRGLGEGDLMGAGQIKPEGFRSLHQLAQMCIPTKQIVNELSTKRFLSANQFATGFGMTVRKRRHRVVHYLQHSLGRGPYRGVVTFPDDCRKFSPHAASADR